MDLLTPARTWATENSPATETTHDHAHAHADRMPALQQLVMFLSVAGPFAALIIAIALLWHRPAHTHTIGWPEIFSMIAMYALTGFGITIGFHRLLTHRSFTAPRPIRLALAICGSAAGQGMLIRWCATHRRHHQLSDRDGDPHSPHLHGESFSARIRGFFHAHVGWCFQPDRHDLARSIPDLLADPALLLIDQLYFLWIALGLLLPAVILTLYSHTWHAFLSGLIWGGLVRICLMQHVTWSINSVCHIWGNRPFKTADQSTNNIPLALVSLGESWHNNHHAFPASARHGLHWWQVDPTYQIIKLMSLLGLAKNIRVPTTPAQQAKLRTQK